MPNNKLTIADLDLCTPLFKAGYEAEEKLLSAEIYPVEELARLETLVETKKLVFAYLTSQVEGLLTTETAKLLKTSILPDIHDYFNQIYYAGLRGFERGLLKYSPSSSKSSPTNYLFQWVATYSKRELMAVEAPNGIPPSTYERYKKVGAVRTKLSNELGRRATNEELLEYFHSGKADMATKVGRVKNAGKPSQANRKMKMSDMEGQEAMAEQLKETAVDTQDSYSSAKAFRAEDAPLFEETLFGGFASTQNFGAAALAVLRSELGDGSPRTVEMLDMLEGLGDREYKSLARLWRDYLADPGGPFAAYAKENGVADATPSGKHHRKSYYEPLFD